MEYFMQRRKLLESIVVPSTLPPPLVTTKSQTSPYGRGISFNESSTDTIVHATCQYTNVVVIVSAANFVDSPRLTEEYEFLFKVVKHLLVKGYRIDDVHHWVFKPLSSVFDQINAAADDTRFTAADALFVDVKRFVLKGKLDELTAEEETPTPEDSPLAGQPPNTPIPEEEHVGIPKFLPSEVYVGSQGKQPGTSEVELKDGTSAFLKWDGNYSYRFFKWEFDTYKQINAASLDDSVRVPRMLGLLMDEKNVCYGLILSKHEVERTSMANKLSSTTSKELRERWEEQITHTLQALHNAGIVWGDAKAHNVMIDSNDDAHLVHFGAKEFTDWVPENKACTKEGDLIGLAKIKQVLHYFGDNIYDDGIVQIRDHGQAWMD